MSDEAKLQLLNGHSHSVSMSNFGHMDHIAGSSGFSTSQARSSASLITSVAGSAGSSASNWIKMSECDDFIGPK